MFGIAVMHPLRVDVKALSSTMQDCNGCEFISKLKEKWQRDPLDSGFDVI